MSLFLPVKTSPNAAIGVCGRCRKKAYLSELRSDPNVPGLRVHTQCADQLDPYRKPARNVEISLYKTPRPEEPLE